jgi:hypothetical protein
MTCLPAVLEITQTVNGILLLIFKTKTRLVISIREFTQTIYFNGIVSYPKQQIFIIIVIRLETSSERSYVIGLINQFACGLICYLVNLDQLILLNQQYFTRFFSWY